MKEIAAGTIGAWWWRISRRTHGVVLIASIHWPTRTWDQWQISLLTIDLSFGRRP
jgi:hypothetical protein